jgi:hypothetical protein
MFVVRARRTYGAFIAALAGILFVPVITLRDELPAVAQAFMIVGILGGILGLLVAFRPPRLVTADSDGATFYSRLFLGRQEWQCPWAAVDSVRGERRLLAGPDGPAEAHLILLRLSAPASVPQGLGQLGGLTSAQLPELQDPHIVIWSLPTPAVSVNEIGAQLAAYLERARTSGRSRSAE